METIDIKRLLEEYEAWRAEYRGCCLRAAIAVPMAFLVTAVFVFWFILATL